MAKEQKDFSTNFRIKEEEKKIDCSLSGIQHLSCGFVSLQVGSNILVKNGLQQQFSVDMNTACLCADVHLWGPDGSHLVRHGTASCPTTTTCQGEQLLSCPFQRLLLQHRRCQRLFTLPGWCCNLSKVEMFKLLHIFCVSLQTAQIPTYTQRAVRVRVRVRVHVLAGSGSVYKSLYLLEEAFPGHAGGIGFAKKTPTK